jgi:ribosomal protein S18 acetylase RimI-like enzyme
MPHLLRWNVKRHNKPTMTIRPLQSQDLPQAARLLETAIESMTIYNAWAKREEVALHQPVIFEQNLIQDPQSLIGAFENESLIGVITSSLEAGLIWLGWIAVNFEHRGRGVARALINALEDSARERGAHKIWCDSRIENEVSNAMLTASRYRCVATLNHHWYGLDYFIWEKPL